LNRESKPIMQAKGSRQRVIERPLRSDLTIIPLESRWADIFVEINQTIRLERAKELHEETLQPRNVMRGLMEERDVIRPCGQHATIEVSSEVSNATGQAGPQSGVSCEME
jgi:hypothetical protein